MLGGVRRREREQPALFRLAERFECATHRAGAPQLHLYKDQGAIVFGHEVNLTLTAAHVAVEHAVAAA